MKKILLSILLLCAMTSLIGCGDDADLESSVFETVAASEQAAIDTETDETEQEISPEESSAADAQADSEKDTAQTTAADSDTKTTTSSNKDSSVKPTTRTQEQDAFLEEFGIVLDDEDGFELPILGNDSTSKQTTAPKTSSNQTTTKATAPKVTERPNNSSGVHVNEDGIVELPFIPIEDIQ